MGNVVIPIPVEALRLNSWTVDKKLFVWRTMSMSCCIIGTGIYLMPLEPYLEVPFFGILVPTFVCGYMIVHSCDIFLLVTRQDYIFLEMCFLVIGGIGTLTCGIYQLYKWCDWMADITTETNDGDYDTPEFILAIVLLLHFASLCVVLIKRIIYLRTQSTNSND